MRTAADLALKASLAATGQYLHAATVHRLAEEQLRADGWDQFADEVHAFVEALERAAQAEAKPWVPLRGSRR